MTRVENSYPLYVVGALLVLVVLSVIRNPHLDAKESMLHTTLDTAHKAYQEVNTLYNFSFPVVYTYKLRFSYQSFFLLTFELCTMRFMQLGRYLFVSTFTIHSKF